MQASTYEPLQPKVVLGIAAHPDDLDFGAAATMARFAAEGADVHYVILTDGSKGSEDKQITQAELTSIREAEQRAAVAAIGGKSVQFLGYPDGELEVTMQLKRDIVKVIRTLKPDVVITMDPSMLYSAARGFINHPDHRAAGQATIDAVFPLARDHMTFPDLYEAGYEPHKTKTLLLINFEHGNFHIDATGYLDVKLAALAAHASQVDIEAVRGFVTQMAETAAEQTDYELAEPFVRIDIR
jgi:LmbE family N-acetylglucosaminyl deacetylase